MTFTRSFRFPFVGLLLLLIALPATAHGATKKRKSPARPTITSVAPLKLGIGDMLTIRGKNFVIGKKVNSVAFKRDGAPAVFVKAAESTRTRMKVIVPATLRRYLSTKDGVAQSTRFRMRLLARRFSLKYTTDKLSPTIDPSVDVDGKTPVPGTTGPGIVPGATGPGTVPGATGPAGPAAPTAPAAPAVAPPSDCDGDGIVDTLDNDDDNDHLSDVLEASLKTDACAKDTDKDSLEDGWEYYSAIDLNDSAVPYPAARPYPNPLFADESVDHDGDGLRGFEEHALWVKFGNRALPLSYSDGTHFTGPLVAAPIDDAHLHLNITSSADSSLDTSYLSDDEKDADGDRLGNWDETRGRATAGYWPVNYTDENPQFTLANYYLHLDYLVPDTDGDGVLDGDDDQDHDGEPATVHSNDPNLRRNNVDELRRARYSTMVHPFNPCLPDWTSRTCPRYLPPPAPYYAPFDKPLPAFPPVPWPRP